MKDKSIMLSDFFIVMGLTFLVIQGYGFIRSSFDSTFIFPILFAIAQIILGYLLQKEGVEKDEHNNNRMSE